MKSKLIPDYIFPNYRAVTPAFLREVGIRGLLVDIDNTLAPYEVAEPDDEIRAWVKALTEDGVKIAFVSNNHPPRVELFNRTLGMPAYPDAAKPLKKKPMQALAELGTAKEETATLGDQIFTDTLGGNCAGLTSILVRPINNHNFWLKARHVLEKPFIYMAKNRRI